MLNPEKAQAIQAAKNYLARQPLFLDTETTGLDSRSEIVEICIADQNGAILFQSLVKPAGAIPLDASRIHGITSAHVQSAPTWPDVWQHVQDLLTGRTTGIYNAEFDLRMIRQTNAQYRIQWRPAQETTFFCIMLLYAQFIGEKDYRRGSFRLHSLDKAGRQCRIPIPNSHRAVDDTLLARQVLRYMAGDFSTTG